MRFVPRFLELLPIPLLGTLHLHFVSRSPDTTSSHDICRGLEPACTKAATCGVAGQGHGGSSFGELPLIRLHGL